MKKYRISCKNCLAWTLVDIVTPDGVQVGICRLHAPSCRIAAHPDGQRMPQPKTRHWHTVPMAWPQTRAEDGCWEGILECNEDYYRRVCQEARGAMFDERKRRIKTEKKAKELRRELKDLRSQVPPIQPEPAAVPAETPAPEGATDGDVLRTDNRQ